MYQYILFDLDGTLTDSREGITKSVQYALDKMGIHEPEPAAGALYRSATVRRIPPQLRLR